MDPPMGKQPQAIFSVWFGQRPFLEQMKQDAAICDIVVESDHPKINCFFSDLVLAAIPTDCWIIIHSNG